MPHDSAAQPGRQLHNVPLHVWAARCAWSGPISKVGLLDMGELRVRGMVITNPGLPCCPHCQSPLFQMEEDKWQAGIPAHEAKGHTNYGEFIKWKEEQPKCWPTLELAASEFTAATGKPVVLGQ